MATGVTQRKSGEESHPRIAETKAPAKGKVGGFSVTVHRALDKVADAIASFKGIFRDNIRSLHIQEEKLMKQINQLPKSEKTNIKNKKYALNIVQRQIKEFESDKVSGDPLRRLKKNEKVLIKGIKEIENREKLITDLHYVQMKIGSMEKAQREVLTVEQKLHGAEKSLDHVIKHLEKPVHVPFKEERDALRRPVRQFMIFSIDPNAVAELDKVKKEIHLIEKSTASKIEKNPEAAKRLAAIHEKILQAELVLHRELLKLKRSHFQQLLNKIQPMYVPSIQRKLADVDKLLNHANFELKATAEKYSEKYSQFVKLNKALIQAQQNHSPELSKIRSELAIVKKECATVAAKLEKEFKQKLPEVTRAELDM